MSLAYLISLALLLIRQLLPLQWESGEKLETLNTFISCSKGKFAVVRKSGPFNA